MLYTHLDLFNSRGEYMLKKGLYEQLLNKALSKHLEQETEIIPKFMPLDQEEASKILAKYLAEVIEKELIHIKGDSEGQLQSQINFVNNIVTSITSDELTIDKRAEMLMAILDKQNIIQAVDEKAQVIRPVTSISQSSLFTGAVHEPAMFSELKKEIVSSDRIDMLVSFIKWSGLRLIIDELRTFTQNGGKLRIITTSYMGATDIKAVEELRKLDHTEIKVSYNTKTTRLHAKTYVFYRNTGFTTAYVGSSNLSNAAISSSLEWNVKVTAKDLPDTIQKIDATFESYWNSSEFMYYTEGEKTRLVDALMAEKKGPYNSINAFNFNIIPYHYQQEILDQLEAERKIRGYYRNLIVAATGTGKTVISAFDYKRFCNENKGKQNRLLFVAHREEILKQSIDCFRGVLKDPNFGELFVGGHKPDTINHLFISIQTFNSQEFYEKTTKDYYDYIIIDEFHHAAAPTYQRLLTYYQSKILLGLTATPERMDGKSIIEYFNNRIAAEIRLPEAIDRKLLCPFQYFGVTDNVDLNELKWARGGYEKSALSSLYTSNDFRSGMIIKALDKYVTDINEVKGLGFCVSKEHAQYMSKMFNESNIPSMYLTSDSPDEERNNAKKRLIDGGIRFIFVVDIYNEGVDIPEVNTILFLRPTESLTVFLQQLGRGLRLADGKECLTVLDFIGQANKKYNFEDKFKALLSNTTKSVQREVKDGFLSLPKGCYIQLEKKAKEYVLKNIRAAFGHKTALISRIATFEEDTGKELNLKNFLDYYHLDIRTIYNRNSFSRLSVLAGVREDFNEPLEETLTKAMSKICAIDSRRWIDFLIKALPNIENLSPNDEEYRMLNMLQYTIFLEGSEDIIKSLSRLKSNPVLLDEILEILKYNYNKIDFIDEKVELGFPCPLDVHCTYTRDQILVAMDYLKPNTVREGVKYLPEKDIDLLFVTLNKSDKDYSPTTMYNDYSINERLFHWQSQSTTTPESPTGKRYANHKVQGSKVLLFVREFKKDLAGTAPYTFLGLCDFVKSEGSKPMNVTWRLHKEIPAKYLKKTNKLVVG
jgi:superfamily II DNA or RNA helicase